MKKADCVIIHPGVTKRGRNKWQTKICHLFLFLFCIILSPAWSQSSFDQTIDTLPAGASVTLTFDVIVNNPLPAGVDAVTVQGTVDATLGGTPFHAVSDDPSTPAPDDATVTAVAAAPDLQLTIDDGGATATAGGLLSYTLTVQNVGNQGASGVVLHETVSEHTAFNASESTADWSCADASPGGTTCDLTIGDLSAADSREAIFAVSVLDPVPDNVTTLTNRASVDDDGANGADPRPGDNSAEIETAVSNVPDDVPIDVALDTPRGGDVVAGKITVSIVSETIASNVAALLRAVQPRITTIAATAMRFQFRPAGSTTWEEIGTDTTPPLFAVVWDTEVLADGSYDLRAIATLDSGDMVTLQTTQIAVSNLDPSLATLVEQSGFKTQAITAGAHTVVVTSNGLVLIIPANALPADDLLTVAVVDAMQAPGVLPGAVGGLLVDLLLDSGLIMLNTPATLLLPYEDADQDGVVDGTAIDEASLTLWMFDADLETWLPVTDAVADATANVLVASPSRLGTFGVFHVMPTDPSALLSVTVGEQSPAPELPVFVSGSMAGGVVLQLQLDTAGELVTLHDITLAMSSARGNKKLAPRLRLSVVNDGNRNGQVDADEAVLASGTFNGMLEPVLLTFETPLEILPMTTVHLVIALEVLPPVATTAARFPVLPRTVFGWGMALPIVAGLVLLPYRLRPSRRFMLGLLVLTLLCAVALTNCSDDDGDTLTFRLALPAHSMNAVGDVSGAITAPDVTIVSPPVIVNP